MGAGYSVNPKAGGTAEILLYEDVGEGWMGGVSAKAFAADLKALGKVTAIDLRINSAGGDVFDGLAIYRQLVDHPARVTTHVDGVAASIASVIAMAGREIRVSEAGFLMIHDAWGLGMGNAADMRELADRLETISGSIGDVYVSRTGKTPEQVRAWMAEETWFTAAAAVEAGFADEVAPNMKVAAKLDPARHRYRNAPTPLAERPNYDAATDRLAKMQVALHRNLARSTAAKSA